LIQLLLFGGLPLTEMRGVS